MTPTVNEARSFPTVQNAKRGAKQVWGNGEKRGGWGKVMMISRGVEISITKGGGEMVRDPIPWSVRFFFSFLFFKLCIHC